VWRKDDDGEGAEHVKYTCSSGRVSINARGKEGRVINTEERWKTLLSFLGACMSSQGDNASVSLISSAILPLKERYSLNDLEWDRAS
jgi:hypothetical protein